jgi:multicomponent Na+:H+ antiporter subunit D
MFEIIIPPALILLIGAFLVAVVQPALRPVIALAAPLATLYAVWQVPDGILLSATFLGYEVQLIEGGPLRRMFATVFAIMAFAGALFSFKQAKWYELAAAMAYASGAIGVSFAGDLIVMFVFWELMALFSVVVVWSGGTFGSKRAGIRYIIMHLLGGIILKIGIEGIMVHTGSVEIRPLVLDNFDTWMVFIGILVNAAAPPVSAWLSDAYPESSPTGSVFLSAFTTKTAVLALILLFPGQPLLIWIGLWMVFYGIIYALLENDIRRILSYSIINQVGFMVVAVGIGTELALNGAAAHAFAHIFYKALLFMSAGAVIYQTGKNKCTELGGLFQSMPLTSVCGIIGALSISSFPLTSGFVSKGLTTAAAAEAHLGVVWFLLAAASAGVFLHAGIKFPWFVFFQKDSGLRPKDPPWNMQAAHGAAVGAVHRDRRVPGAAVLDAADAGGLRAVHGGPRRHHAPTALVRGAGVLRDAADDETHAHHQSRPRLVLARGVGEAVSRGGAAVQRHPHRARRGRARPAEALLR